MATSGVEVHEDVKITLDTINKRKLRYAIFKIADDSKNIVEDLCEETQEAILVNLKEGPDEAEKKSEISLASLKQRLSITASEPRYIYFNYVCDKGGRTVDKNVLFHFNPDNGKIKHKMLYSSSKDAIKKVITTSFVDFHLTDLSDLVDYKEVKSQVLTKSGST